MREKKVREINTTKSVISRNKNGKLNDSKNSTLKYKKHNNDLNNYDEDNSNRNTKMANIQLRHRKQKLMIQNKEQALFEK